VTRPRFEPEQEVRFAVVLFGGVSLAIYINGVAQELFRLVRATAPDERWPRLAERPEAERRTYFADAGSDDARPALSGSAQVYRRLGQVVGLHGPAEPPQDGDEPPPVRTRFVVDIVSGTSAGGINGVFLAKAIANQEDFDVSERIWLEAADLDGLLRGEGSWTGIAPRPGREPESLLNGYRLFAKARDALEEMDAGRKEVPEDPFRPGYAEQLELTITATDLAGLPEPVRLRPDRIVREPVHRKVFHFEYGTQETRGEDYSDFDPEANLLLAFAARATSSFPLAFEPVRLADLEPLAPAGARADPARWLGEYRDPAGVYFADGGYLDNKPFSYATQALRRRRADVPVARKLLYVEPDPAPDDPREPERRRPDPYENLAGMFELPRFEPIRQDIADVAQRNGAVARLRALEGIADAAIDGPLDAGGPGAAAYRALRTHHALDDLAALAARLSGADDAQESQIRDVLATAAGRLAPGGLDDVDTGFEQRRLAFLQDRATEGLRERPPEGRARALRRVKLELNAAFADLRRAERAPEARDLDELLDAEERAAFERLRTAAGSAAEDPDALLVAARAFLAGPLDAARTGIATAFDRAGLDDEAKAVLHRYDQRFAAFDAILLPLAYPDLGEVNPVEIWRVSPRDAPGVQPEVLADPVEKLAGIAKRHFAAFFDADWRANDILWGRLDGAEAIVHAVLPAPEHRAVAEAFRLAAQAAILRESLAGGALAGELRAELAAPASPDADRALVEAFRRRWRKRPERLAPDRERHLVGASARIASDVLAEHAAAHRIPPLVVRAAGRGAPLVVRVLDGLRSLRERLPWRRRSGVTT
jgi:predicted acylesterase/phospholipase RssA